MCFAHEIKLLIREQRYQMLKRYAVTNISRRAAIDQMYLTHREILLTLHGGTDGSLDNVTCLETVSLDLRLLYINVIRRREIIIITGAQEAITLGGDVEHTLCLKNSVEVIGLVQIGIDFSNLLLLLLFHLALLALALLHHFRFLDNNGSNGGLFSLTAAFFLGLAHCLFAFLLSTRFESESATCIEERIE